MSATSIVMMIVAMLIVWGGLAASIVILVRNDRRTGSGDPGPDVRPGGAHFSRDL